MAFDDGPLWAPASDISSEVLLTRSQRGFRDAVLAGTQGSPRPVIWHSKPYGRTLAWSLALAHQGAISLVIDVDDDDAGFGELFRQSRFRNRLQLNPLRAVSPERIRRRLASLRQAHVFTSSSAALSRHLELPTGTATVPHVRPASPRLNSPSDLSRPRFGFFGTPRSYKGLTELRAFVRESADRGEFHLFWDPETASHLSGPNVVWHEPVPMSDLRSVYEQIDILMLPQLQHRAAQFQTPAKLSDALQFRRVVLATPTPAIAEAAGEAFEPVENWNDPPDIWRAVGRAASRHADHSRRVDLAFSNLTIDRVASRLGASVFAPAGDQR